MDCRRCEVTWKNLNLVSEEGEKILHNVSGQLQPGALTAIMGPSGSGKTSLLTTLAGRISDKSCLTGEIKLNGKDRTRENWFKTVSLVPQHFDAYEYQSVYETLMFTANIKLNSEKEASLVVESLLNTLGLSGIRNLMVKKLSGGERVRLSLGLELIGEPSVLFVDEPLSGLDSFNAVNVLKILKNLASMGKTVVLTIHQASSLMTKFFDNIILMCSGSTVFQGSLDNCTKFFSECGYECPSSCIPTDHFLDVLSVDTTNEKTKNESLNRIATIKKEWSLIEPDYDYNVNETIVNKLETFNTGYIKKLVQRSLYNYYRQTFYLKAKLFQKMSIALIFTVTYFGLGVKNAPVFSFRGLITFIFQNELFSVSGPIMNSFIEERKIIARERMAGMYSSIQAFYAKYISELIINCAYDFVINAAIYFCVDFVRSFKAIFFYYLTILTIISFSITWGILISAVSPSTQAAQVLGATFNLFFIVFSGAFSSSSTSTKFTRACMKLSPVHYAFRALVLNQIKNIPKSVPIDKLSISNPKSIEVFGLEGAGVKTSLLMLVFYTLIAQALAIFFLHKKTRNNLKTIKNEGFKV